MKCVQMLICAGGSGGGKSGGADVKLLARGGADLPDFRLRSRIRTVSMCIVSQLFSAPSPEWFTR
jgi:hypothetical protein